MTVPAPSATCPRCGAPIIRARLSDDQIIVLDYRVTSDGRYGAWWAPGMRAGWRARLDGDRFGGGRALHECTIVNQQMELSA